MNLADRINSWIHHRESSKLECHYRKQVEVYAVTREQLELISREAESEWKTRWQNGFSILLTCLINIIALGWNFENPSFRMNIGIGLIALVFGVTSLVFFMKDMHRHHSRLNDILKQPIQNTPIKEELMQ